ncbi:MAG: hypothetical protein ACI8PT_002798, partial [Gammaproteobacteria bacterium]
SCLCGITWADQRRSSDRRCVGCASRWGRHADRKVFTLPDVNESLDVAVGKVAGFSLQAGVAARAYERKKFERLCCGIARSAVSQ